MVDLRFQLEMYFPDLCVNFSRQEPEQSNLFVLVSQNKALSLEMMSYKKTITEGRKELELMRRKSREMEALVSLIQRAWSQVQT